MDVIFQVIKHLKSACDSSIVGVCKNRFKRRFNCLSNSSANRQSSIQSKMTYMGKGGNVWGKKEIDTLGKCLELQRFLKYAFRGSEKCVDIKGAHNAIPLCRPTLQDVRKLLNEISIKRVGEIKLLLDNQIVLIQNATAAAYCPGWELRHLWALSEAFQRLVHVSK